MFQRIVTCSVAFQWKFRVDVQLNFPLPVSVNVDGHIRSSKPKKDKRACNTLRMFSSTLNATGVCERSDPFAQALALQSGDISCDPAPDLVFWKLICPPVFLSRGVVFSQTPIIIAIICVFIRERQRTRGGVSLRLSCYGEGNERRRYRHYMTPNGDLSIISPTMI